MSDAQAAAAAPADAAAAAGLPAAAERPPTAGRRAEAKDQAKSEGKADEAAAGAAGATSKTELRYWGVLSRGVAPYFVAGAAGVLDKPAEFEWSKNYEFPKPDADFKAFAPFGCLPCLADGDLIMGESMAICRYMGRKHKVGECATLYDFGKSEQVIEVSSGIFASLSSANYSYKADGSLNRVAAFNAVFEALPKKLAMIEATVEESGWFGKAGMTLGDVVFAGIMYACKSLEPTVLDASPKLKALCEKVEALPGLKDNLGDKAGGPYFQRTDA